MNIPTPIETALAARRLRLSLLVRSGSRAYGLDLPGSDEDYAGVFLAPLREAMSIAGIESDTVVGTAPDFTIHEFGKFCRLALKGNPAALEVLWCEDQLASDEWGRAMVENRRRFLHRASPVAYVAYAESQMKRMLRGGGLHSKGGVYGEKYGAHLIRLLHAGLALAETGEVTVRVPPEHLELLRKIRLGETPEQEVARLAEPLIERLRAAVQANDLPDAPDVEFVNDLVVRARLSMRDG